MFTNLLIEGDDLITNSLCECGCGCECVPKNAEGGGRKAAAKSVSGSSSDGSSKTSA